MSVRDTEGISSPVSQRIIQGIARLRGNQQGPDIVEEEVEIRFNSVHSSEYGHRSRSPSHSIDYSEDTETRIRRERRSEETEHSGGVEESKVEEEEVPVAIIETRRITILNNEDIDNEEGSFEVSEGGSIESETENNTVSSAVYSSEGSSTSDSSSDWNSSTSSEGTWVTDSSNTSEETYAKMGGEKDIPKFNGDRAGFESWMVRWMSHGIVRSFPT